VVEILEEDEDVVEEDVVEDEDVVEEDVVEEDVEVLELATEPQEKQAILYTV
jgi:hypothetical protein